jgi:hypothetical protein
MARLKRLVRSGLRHEELAEVQSLAGLDGGARRHKLHRSGDTEFRPDADDRQRRGKDGSRGFVTVFARATTSPKASAYPHERSVSPPRIALSGFPPLRRQQEFFVHMIHALNELTIF